MTQNVDGFVRLKEVEVARQRVFVRADLDCPADAEGELTDDAKLKMAIPTLRYLLDAEAQVVVAGHRGVLAAGEDAQQLPSMDACAARLAELLDAEVYLPDESVGPLARKLFNELRPGRLLVLDNLGRDPREAAGDSAFARELATGIDVFVGDCLAGPHEAASQRVVPRLARQRTIGLRLEEELVAVNRLRHLWGAGLVLVLGGTFAEHRPLLQHLEQRGSVLCAGGALGLTLAQARAGASATNPAAQRELAEARSWLEKAHDLGLSVELAHDIVCERAGQARTIALTDAGPDEVVLDLGPTALNHFGTRLNRAKAALVAGPFGHVGVTDDTMSASRALLDRAAQGLGFVTVLHDAAMPVRRWLPDAALSRLGFVSTAGPAFVALLCQQKLAGIEALRRAG